MPWERQLAVVYPSHQGNSREAQVQPRSALLHGHDLLGCDQPQICHRHTQTSTEVHQPQDKASVYRSWLTSLGKSTMMFCSSTSSQKARDCFSKLAGGQRSGSYSKTMFQLIRQRKTCNASAPMSQEGFSWNGLPAHLICLPLRISGVGWNNSWVTERASTVLMTCKVD